MHTHVDTWLTWRAHTHVTRWRTSHTSSTVARPAEANSRQRDSRSSCSLCICRRAESNPPPSTALHRLPRLGAATISRCLFKFYLALFNVSLGSFGRGLFWHTCCGSGRCEGGVRAGGRCQAVGHVCRSLAPAAAVLETFPYSHILYRNAYHVFIRIIFAPKSRFLALCMHHMRLSLSSVR